MADILFIHGIGQQRKSAETLHDELSEPLNDGLREHYAPLPAQSFTCAFYADLFSLPGLKALGDPPYDASDISAEEAELLNLFWRAASRTDPAVARPDLPAKYRIARFTQSALWALSNSRFFTGISERAFIGNLKQVTAYFNSSPIDYLGNKTYREAIRARIHEAISPDTKIVIAHSLGSGAAY